MTVAELNQDAKAPLKRRARTIDALGKIIKGDCLKVMEAMPAKCIGGIVTSPPYNIKNSTGNGLKNGAGGKWPNAALQKGYHEHNDNMPYSHYVEWQRDCLNAMMRVLNDKGVIFYNHKWRVQKNLWQDRYEIVSGFPVRQIIIWHRAGGINFNPGYFLPTYEVIYMIAKPDFVLTKGANKYGDVWRINQESNNKHPAPFPLKLAERCVTAIPMENGVILDPFMGSGTTAVAAQRQGRMWTGIEMSQKYINHANRRIEADQWS